MKTSLYKNNKIRSYPPPPPPPSSQQIQPKKKRTSLIAAIVTVVLIVVIIAALIFSGIIPLLPKSNPSPSPSPTYTPLPTSTALPTLTPTITPATSPSATPLPTATNAPNIETFGVLIGTVVDDYGDALPEVNVTIGAKTGVTNGQGWFSIANVTPGNYQVVKFSKTGYVTTYRLTDIQKGVSSYTQAALKAADATQEINASQEATVTDTSGNSKLTIPANSLTQQGTPYNGTAVVSLTAFDPTDQNEAQAFPGEYIGKAANDTVAPIKSFGFADISITDQNGAELQLSAGKPATLSITVPASMQTEASQLASCPLWWFESAAGLWEEQGQAIYNATSESFTGDITHFSTWNFDFMYRTAFVSGRIVDIYGNPISGAQMKCWANGWIQQRWANSETFTGENGRFTRIPVEAGVVFQYEALKGGHQSDIFSAGPLNANTETDVGDIVLASPTVTITLTWGSDPRDLDSHLTARLVGNSTFHIYYGDMGTLTSAPFASLDTDERYGNGPEIISISQMQPGTYQYSVRHYLGAGAISTSSAQVTLIGTVQGEQFVRTYTPPASQQNGTDIWRVFTIRVDSTGRITAINDIMDYVTGDDYSPLLYPP